MKVKNFGGNVVYEPQHFYEPKTEDEVLKILEKHKNGHIRVQSTGHSWSDIVEADDAYIRMSNFTWRREILFVLRSSWHHRGQQVHH